MCIRDRNGGVISLPKSRAGEGFVAALECCITMVKDLVSTCGEVNVLIVLGQDFLHVSSVESTNNNEGCLWVHILQTIDNLIQFIQSSGLICLGGV